MLRHALHPRDTILLGEASWIYETDHAEIEEQVIIITISYLHDLEFRVWLKKDIPANF